MMVIDPHGLDEYFAQVNPDRIRAREAEFERLDLSVMTPEEVYSELMFVISLAETRCSSTYTMLPTDSRLITPGTLLWRGRALDTDDHVLPLRDMNSIADAWEAPSLKIKSAGRLNKVGESLLYASYDNPLAVPDEIRVGDNEYFSLMKYQTFEEVRLTAIGLPVPVEHLSDSASLGAEVISGFFGRQFSRKARTKDGVQYHLSELIAKYNYDLPPEIHHGWIYPSVEFPGALNVTLRPEEAHLRMALVGICICKAFRSTEGLKLSGFCYSDGMDDGRGFKWYQQGSPVQLELFPEFSS